MFDPRTELANSHVHAFDPTSRINDSWRAMNFGTKAQKTAQNYENYRNWEGGGVQFRPDNMEDESGVCSPPLWGTSPPRSPVHPRHPQINYRFLSPTSRAQAIARGQWELMEMVKNMPESSYELSLKDLVEHNHRRLEAQGSKAAEEINFGTEIINHGGRVKRQGSNQKKVNMMRSGSFENRGLFIKMGFPISWGSKKKKNSVTNTCAKVSPKPEASDKTSKGVEKEWWKKRSSVSGESESGGTCSNSGSTGSSSSSRSNSSWKKSGCLPSCWSFFHPKKSKSAK